MTSQCGSASLTTDRVPPGRGNVVHEARYLPYGGVRWEKGAKTTDYGFTGQRAEASFGLMDFNARYYIRQSRYDGART